MTRPTFDPIMRDRHAWVQVVLGKAGSGKTSYMNLVLALWRQQVGGHSLAIDAVSPPRPSYKHLAYWASAWCIEPPEQLRPEFSLVACDEAQRFLGTGGLRGGGSKVLQEITFRGRHTGRYGTSALLGTQRAKHIHPDVWSQAKRVVCFRTIDEHDLERIGDLAGMTPEALKLLPHLPPGYAVVWDEADGLFYPWVPEWSAATAARGARR